MRHLPIVGALILATVAGLNAAAPAPLPTAQEVVSQMQQRDAQRRALLSGYHGLRRYVLENYRMHKRAEMLASVDTDAQGVKHFSVVEQQGWQAAHRHVFCKMLDSEAEASTPQIRLKTQLSAENYDFHLDGIETVAGRPAYAISVKPKRHEERLFEGKIWVDAQDYALARAEGRPAKNPSFWVRSIHFDHTYQKSGEFWYPVSTQSVSEARVFGTTKVTINYFDYTPNFAHGNETANAATDRPPASGGSGERKQWPR
jgi:hypothetical protein